jgi:hypothetical protein
VGFIFLKAHIWITPPIKFGEDWEVLSTLTKDEIINGDHNHKRLIHDKAWGRKIREMLAYA